MPHPPQWDASFCVLRQRPSQSVSPAAQRHMLAMHVCSGAHCVPHIPQLLSSLVRVTHDAPHAVCPAGHAS